MATAKKPALSAKMMGVKRLITRINELESLEQTPAIVNRIDRLKVAKKSMFDRVLIEYALSKHNTNAKCLARKTVMICTSFSHGGDVYIGKFQPIVCDTTVYFKSEQGQIIKSEYVSDISVYKEKYSLV